MNRTHLFQCIGKYATLGSLVLCVVCGLLWLLVGNAISRYETTHKDLFDKARIVTSGSKPVTFSVYPSPKIESVDGHFGVEDIDVQYLDKVAGELPDVQWVNRDKSTWPSTITVTGTRGGVDSLKTSLVVPEFEVRFPSSLAGSRFQLRLSATIRYPSMVNASEYVNSVQHISHVYSVSVVDIERQRDFREYEAYCRVKKILGTATLVFALVVWLYLYIRITS